MEENVMMEVNSEVAENAVENAISGEVQTTNTGKLAKKLAIGGLIVLGAGLAYKKVIKPLVDKAKAKKNSKVEEPAKEVDTKEVDDEFDIPDMDQISFDETDEIK